VPAPTRRSRSKQRASRIPRARKHDREQRPINEARRCVEEARKEEVTAHKFRNHMRDMLFLFKGKPSTSPFWPGSTTHENPKSFHRIGNRHHWNPYPMTRRSDER
jgi:hypothetical protein